MDQPARYEIRIQGQLNASWSDWLSGMAVSVEEPPDSRSITVLSGTIIDQAALHGLLARIRDLNLVILSVTQTANQHEIDGP